MLSYPVSAETNTSENRDPGETKIASLARYYYRPGVYSDLCSISVLRLTIDGLFLMFSPKSEAQTAKWRLLMVKVQESRSARTYKSEDANFLRNCRLTSRATFTKCFENGRYAHSRSFLYSLIVEGFVLRQVL